MPLPRALHLAALLCALPVASGAQPQPDTPGRIIACARVQTCTLGSPCQPATGTVRVVELGSSTGMFVEMPDGALVKVTPDPEMFVYTWRFKDRFYVLNAEGHDLLLIGLGKTEDDKPVMETTRLDCEEPR